MEGGMQEAVDSDMALTRCNDGRKTIGFELLSHNLVVANEALTLSYSTGVSRQIRSSKCDCVMKCYKKSNRYVTLLINEK